MSGQFSGPTLELPGQLKRGLSAGHPWVYRDHVPRGFQAASGTWVKVRCGAYAAFALWDETSRIALRMFSEQGVPDELFRNPSSERLRTFLGRFHQVFR